jgi:hypothetical protein
MATRIVANRKAEPIGNSFPTAALNVQAAEEAVAQRKREFERWQGKLPPNEQRVANSLVNIITGELKDPKAASSVAEFCGRSTWRAEVAGNREKAIIADREERARVAQARVGCRFNNGRMLELRDWNVINGYSVQPEWDETVKMMPTAWEWCSTEALPGHRPIEEG